MGQVTLEEVKELLADMKLEESVLKELMYAKPDLFSREGLALVQIREQAKQLEENRIITRAMMMVVGSGDDDEGVTVSKVLYPQITLEEVDPHEEYWLGDTTVERRVWRQQKRAEMAEAMAKSEGVSVFQHGGSLAFYKYDWDRIAKEDARVMMTTLNIRRANMAVEEFLFVVDRKISQEKVPGMSSPFNKYSAVAGVYQHYECTEIDVAASPEERLIDYPYRVSNAMWEALLGLEVKLRAGSGIVKSKKVESVEWFIITDPRMARYLDIHGGIKIEKSTVVATFDLRMDGRMFLVPRITYTNGKTESFGWRISDISQLQFVEDKNGCGHTLKHADEHTVVLPIVGELDVKNIRKA